MNSGNLNLLLGATIASCDHVVAAVSGGPSVMSSEAETSPALLQTIPRVGSLSVLWAIVTPRSFTHTFRK